MGKKKDGAIVFWIIPTWHYPIFLTYFDLRIGITSFWKWSHFSKFETLCSKLTISGSLVNGIWNVHSFHNVTFVSRLKKMATKKKFSFLNKISVLFDWTQGKYFVFCSDARRIKGTYELFWVIFLLRQCDIWRKPKIKLLSVKALKWYEHLQIIHPFIAVVGFLRINREMMLS